ncbi:MAG: LacI family DNA-binding transcriptional regulator [Steroidobacteraceae bacterium]
MRRSSAIKSKKASSVKAAAPKAGRVRLTINDIARLARVSKKTVSRVINKSPFVKEQTRSRVAGIISEHSYEPDPQARGLAFRRSFLVGMIYDNPNPQYVVNMQQGILDALSELGMELVIRPVDRRKPAFLDDMRSFVERQKPAGIIMPPSVSEDEGLVEVLRLLNCPYVRIASVPLDSPDRMVVTHDRKGGEQAGRLLAELGHKRIAHISGPTTFRSAHERRQGFIDGLKDHGLEMPPEFSLRGEYTYASGVACGRQLLDRVDPPTAIFTGNDEMATGVYNIARELGYAIPKDLSVVGFDDAPIAERLWPPLTSVRLPIREMGRVAALMLFANQEKGGSPSGLFEPRLVQRHSTAAPPVKAR